MSGCKIAARTGPLTCAEAIGAYDAHQSDSGWAGRQLALMVPGWKIVGMNSRNSGNRQVLASLTFAVLLACCAPADEEATSPGIRDEVYVQVMAELMILDAGAPVGETPEEQEARADSMRAEILAAQGVTAQELLDFVEVVGGDASRMESLWALITQKYDSTRIADLRRETEARSETEGKLGAEARAGASGSATGAAGEADSTGTLGSPGDATGQRVRERLLRRPSRSRPATGDSTASSG